MAEESAYFQNNLELAQENGQLKQMLGQFRSQQTNATAEIIELKSQITQLSSIKEKYDNIVRIVLDIGSVSSNSSTLSLPRSTYDSPKRNGNGGDNDEDSETNQKNLDRITEKSFEDEQDNQEHDSLQPAEVTGVTPLRPERPAIQTPSIWALLDETRAPDVFHSTPILNLANMRQKNLDNQENLSEKSISPVKSPKKTKKVGRPRKRKAQNATPEEAAPRYNLRKRVRSNN